MTDSNGEIISVGVDPAGQPFFYVSHSRASALRQALEKFGFKSDPSDAGEIVLRDDFDPDDDGEEVVVFSSSADPNKLQDVLDELTWLGGRIVRELVP